ncbi:MAG: methyltransferase [archaeon]|jgi:release factor glutamine methyltransferase|nr:methyltransferase [archaeon]
MIYSPREDSFLLEREVKKLAKGRASLDMGCGSGIQGKAALSSGAKSVSFSDINPEAIKELKKQGFDAVKSDLFSDIKEKFDLVSFNPPYLPENKEEGRESGLANSGGKRGDELILRFLKQVKFHLNRGGIILLVLSSLTPRDKIEILLKKQKMHKKLLGKQSFFMESLEVWKISTL